MHRPSTISDDDYHKIFAAIMQNAAREDSNTGQRVGWAIGLSAGLFAAVAFMVPRVNDYCSGAFWPPMICLAIAGIAGLGLFFSLKAGRGVRAAHEQIEYLRRHYDHHIEQFNRLMLPRPFGDPTAQWGLESADVFPRTLMAFWSVILGAALVAGVMTLARAATDPAAIRCASTTAATAPASNPPAARR